MRAQAGKMRTMHEQMMQGGGMPEAWPDRLAHMERMLSARLDAVKAMEEPVRALYAVLSPEQQKKANELISHRMGGM
jgi:Spy/CpxP family protein refolding chaperone